MKFYCSKCGIQLEHSRKAVPGRGLILDLIAPHECEGFSIKSNPNENPTVEEIITKTSPLSKAKIVSSSRKGPEDGQSTFDLSDRRRDKKSIAPQSLLDAMAKNKIEPGGVSEG